MPNIFYFLLFLNFFAYFFIFTFYPPQYIKAPFHWKLILQAFFLLVFLLNYKTPRYNTSVDSARSDWLENELRAQAACMKNRKNERTKEDGQPKHYQEQMELKEFTKCCLSSV